MNPVLMKKDALIDEMMDRETQKRFIPSDRRRAFGEYAWNKGFETALRIEKAYPQLTPEQIAKKMGLKVEDKDGPGFYLSEYIVNKKSIVLFTNTIQSGFIEEESDHLKTTDYKTVRQLFLAHELFHHLECSEPDVGLTYKERQVTVFSIGPFQWKSGLRCLSEIAAHSFALRLTGVAIIH